MERKLLLIFNKTAGKGKIAKNLSEIIDVFTKNGFLCTVVTTQHPKHMTELVNKMGERYDYVVVSGGDGSLMEAVTGLVSIPLINRPVFGYIPAGSTNDFAKSIGIPSNMIRAAEHIAEGNCVRCDVGVFNEELFSYVAAFGAFTEVTYATPQEYKNLYGHQAYYIEGVKSLQNIKPIKMVIDADGEMIEGSFIFGMISNSKSVGGVRNWAGKDVILDDGIYEMTLVRAFDRPTDLNEILPQLFTGRTSEYVIRRKCRKVHFSMQENVDWVLDGEYGGGVSEAEIEVLHRELSIVV